MGGGADSRGRRLRSWAPGGSYHCSIPRLTSWRPRGRSREAGCAFFCFFLLLFIMPARLLLFCNFLGAHHNFLRQAWRAKGSLQRAATARTADGKTGRDVRCHSLDRLYASMIKQKKKDCYQRGSYSDDKSADEKGNLSCSVYP